MNDKNRYLSGSEFSAALELLKARGISKNALHKLLGCGNKSPLRWSREGCPKYVAAQTFTYVALVP